MVKRVSSCLSLVCILAWGKKVVSLVVSCLFLYVFWYGKKYFMSRSGFCFRMAKEIENIKGMFGTARTEAHRRYIPPVLPEPDTAVSSVRRQYRYRKIW